MGGRVGLADLNLATDYRTGSGDDGDPASSFYAPCLRHSITYLRAAGYFRSSVLALMGPAYIDFAKSGGRAVLICSPEMDEEDIQAIKRGTASAEDRVADRLTEDLDALLRDASLRRPVEILATLVALGILRIKIAFRPDASGIYHEKLGCFLDEAGARVSFIGSANETYSAWSDKGNFESVEVFCSWDSARDEARTQKHESYLRSLVQNDVPGVHVLEFPEAAQLKLFERALGSIEDLDGPRANTVALLSGKKPDGHQVSALDSWRKAGHKGILKHATGSGKTITAILAIAEHVATGSPALVLVPSQLLQQQWEKEILDNIQDAIVLPAGGGATRWRDRYVLAANTAPNVSRQPRITLAVMATAASKEFIAKLHAGDHLLVVADEVHQLGSPKYSQFMAVDAGKRLGLSATPERHGDPEGTSKLLAYFGPVLDPVVTLQDAIAARRLVPYEYHVYGVRLSESESEEWKQLSKRISFLIGGEGNAGGEGGGSFSEEAKRLIIKRSRIAKKAAAKVPKAAQIVKENYNESERWLVYCEDVQHMKEVADAIGAIGIRSSLYHSAMLADKDATLSWFERNGGILLAVRCLDEGIDIPRVSHALILASSQNPRQFIQRRGRILRRHPEKEFAMLHDVVVMPVDEDDDPLRALESEFVRAVEFANDSMNPSVHADLIRLALDSGIDVTKHYPSIEDDDGD